MAKWNGHAHDLGHTAPRSTDRALLNAERDLSHEVSGSSFPEGRESSLLQLL